MRWLEEEIAEQHDEPSAKQHKLTTNQQPVDLNVVGSYASAAHNGTSVVAAAAHNEMAVAAAAAAAAADVHNGTEDARALRKIRSARGFELDASVLGSEQIAERKIQRLEGEEDLAGEGRRYVEEGAVLEPFNIVDEQEQGHFDEHGSFTFDRNTRKQAKKMAPEQRDQALLEKLFGDQKQSKHVRQQVGQVEEEEEEQEQDTWVAQLEDSELQSIQKRTRTTEQIAERLAMQRQHLKRGEENMAKLPDSNVDLKFMICDMLLSDDESVSDALKRLEPIKQVKPRQLSQQHLHNGSHNVVQQQVPDYSQQQFDTLSNVAFKLSSMGEFGIYESTRQELLQELDSKRTSAQWEFKWENKADSPIHGPYSTETMLQWITNGQFSGIDVQVRQCPVAPLLASESCQQDVDIFANGNTTTLPQPVFVPLSTVQFLRFK